MLHHGQLYRLSQCSVQSYAYFPSKLRANISSSIPVHDEWNHETCYMFAIREHIYSPRQPVCDPTKNLTSLAFLNKRPNETTRRELLFLSVHQGRERTAWLLAFCFAACVSLNFVWPLSCAAADSSKSSWQTVRIASEGARPPYNYLEHNKLAGFEIDLARDLCARMKVSCSFIAQDWDGLIPGLLAHHYDAIMAAMEITDEARQKIAFTKPYVRMPSAFMTLKEHATLDTNPAGLVGKSIGVEFRRNPSGLCRGCLQTIGNPPLCNARGSHSRSR